LERLKIKNTCFSPCNHPQLPPDIECFACSLTELRIEDTKITYLPKRIGKLIHLQVLELSNTGLESLPDSIGDLSSLEFLLLPKNNLKLLPRTMGNLKSLKQITLTDNPYLHSVQLLNGLPSLGTLYARHCSINYLPQNLPKLNTLDMTSNNLTTLIGIETLGNGIDTKKSFYFGKNHIQSVPLEIHQVKNLWWLKLNNNKLSDVPTDVYNITTLSYLNIKQNPFRRKVSETIVPGFHETHPMLTILYDD
jgi:Leucine-rich repeat (LRR) protein